MLNVEDVSRIKGFRFPRSVIGYAGWACHRFALSLRDVEDLLAERGVTVSYETIRARVGRFGHQFAARIRRDRPAPADKWPLDEVVIRMKGRSHRLWRAVDANGDVTRHSGPVEAGRGRCQAVLAQTLETLGAPARSGDRQAAVLWGCKGRGRTRDRASPAQRFEQSQRSLPPTYRKARKGDGPVQVPTPSPTFSVGTRSNRSPVPPETPPPLRQILPSRKVRRVRSLDRRCCGTDRPKLVNAACDNVCSTT
jgi:hypothetical protein